MKKKIFSLVAIAAISLGVWNYSENQSNVEISDLALANVEALANGESGGGSCQWATMETWEGWQAICITTGVGYSCNCGDVKPYY